MLISAKVAGASAVAVHYSVNCNGSGFLLCLQSALTLPHPTEAGFSEAGRVERRSHPALLAVGVDTGACRRWEYEKCWADLGLQFFMQREEGVLTSLLLCSVPLCVHCRNSADR